MGKAPPPAIAKSFTVLVLQQIGDDLRHLKILMKAGEIATTAGQPTEQK